MPGGYNGPAAQTGGDEVDCAMTKKNQEESNVATLPARPAKAPRPGKKQTPPRHLPLWKVLLHNDDKNTREFVVTTIVSLTPLDEREATLRMDEADKTGVALLLMTHKERAELYKDQFQSMGLTVTIEPDEEQ